MVIMAKHYKKVVDESTAKQIAARNERNRSAANVASVLTRRGIEDHMERKRLRKEYEIDLSEKDRIDYSKYCFECENDPEVMRLFKHYKTIKLGVKK